MPPECTTNPDLTVGPVEQRPRLELSKTLEQLTPRAWSSLANDLDRDKKQYEDRLEQFAKSLEKYDQGMLDRFYKISTGEPLDDDGIQSTVTEIAQISEKISPKTKRCYATFSMKLLGQIHRFAPVGDVLVGGAQSLAISAAWGAIRLGIEISLAWSSLYEMLSDMLLRIGGASEMNRDFTCLFPKSLRLQAFEYQYLTLVVEVLEKVVKFANGSMLGKIFKAVVFKQEFEALEQRLSTIASNIDRCATQEAMRSNQEGHSTVIGLLKRVVYTKEDLKKDRRIARKMRLFSAFKPDHVAMGVTIWRRLSEKGSSSWFPSLPKFNEWKQTSESAVLWLDGHLGSGKSVTLAWVIGTLKQTSTDSKGNNFATSYYFCGPARTDARLILASIAQQILEHRGLSNHLDALLDESEFENLTTEQLHDYISLVSSIVPGGWTVFIVLDGVDECLWQETHEVFVHLKRLSETVPVQLLCSSRTNWEGMKRAEAFLKPWTVTRVSMQDIDRSSEATHLIASEMLQWEAEGWNLGELKDPIRDRLLAGWGNMFLWLSLQLQLIYVDLRSGQQPQHIFDRLPKELGQIYDRALEGITSSNREIARTVFQLVAAADVPMKFNELRVAMNITPGMTRWEPNTLFPDPSMFCWGMGKYLLEVDRQDDSVHFTHVSVIQHICDFKSTKTSQASNLTSCYHFNIEEASRRLAAVCMTYLRFGDEKSDALILQHSTEDQPLLHHFKVIPNPLPENDMISPRLARHIIKFQQRLNPSLSVSEGILAKKIHAKSSSCDFHDLLRYAKDNWLPLSQCLGFSILDEHETALWDYLVEGAGFHKHFPESLRDPVAALKWSIEHSHIALFWTFLPNKRLRHYVMHSQEHRKLQAMIFEGFDGLKTYGPLLANHFEWLWINDEKFFRTKVDEIFEILFDRPVAGIEFIRTPSISNEADSLKSVARALLEVMLSSGWKSGTSAKQLLKLLPHLDLNQTIHWDPNIYGLNESLKHAGMLPPLQFVSAFDPQGSEKIEVLLGCGASLKHLGDRAPLHHAVINNHISNVRTLLQHDDDINRRDWELGTCLMRAADNDLPDMINYLMRHGADLSATDIYGRTAIHSAATNGARNGLESLFSIDPQAFRVVASVRDKEGRTALDDAGRRGGYAIENRLKEMLQL